MLNTSIKTIVTQSEGKTLEFKRDLSSPKPLLKTLVAFANTAGGKLIIGVTDERKVIGVKNPLDEEERLCSLIADSIAPRLVPNLEMITIEGETLLLVEVYSSGLRPHYLKSEGAENGIYVRLGSTNRKADRELISELRRTVEGVVFDEMPIPDLTIDNLDLNYVNELFRSRHDFTEKELITLKLLTLYQGRLVPTKGAVILFGKEKNLLFPDTWIQCGRFIGKDKANIFDHIDIHDHLPKAVESIILFLKKHAMRGADFSDIRRKDLWSIPITILREVVINALVHADYSQRGAPIRVAFFDDRIEIENPGILLPGMTIDDMKQGISKIRNSVIARIFREINLIEQWGSGVPRIFKEANELGLPEPKILEIGMRLRFIVPLHETLTVSINKQDNIQSGAQSGAQSEQLLLVLSDSPLSASELVNLLGLESKTGALKRTIKELLEKSFIEYTIPDKPNSRLQKYRLTHKGKIFLNNHGI